MEKPPRIVLQGDKLAADRLRLRHGVRVLQEFERLTYFQRLTQNERRIDFDDGSFIYLQTRFGDKTALYYAPPQTISEPEKRTEPTQRIFYRLPLYPTGIYTANGYALFPAGSFTEAVEVHPDFTDTAKFIELPVSAGEQDTVQSRYRSIETGGVYTHLKTYTNNMTPSLNGHGTVYANEGELFFTDPLGNPTTTLGGAYWYNEDLGGGSGSVIIDTYTWLLPWQHQTDNSYHGLGGVAYQGDLTKGYFAVVTEESVRLVKTTTEGSPAYATNVEGFLKFLIDGNVVEEISQTVATNRSFAFDETTTQVSLDDLKDVMDFNWPRAYLCASRLSGGNHYFYSADTGTEFIVGVSTGGAFTKFSFNVAGGQVVDIPFGDEVVPGHRTWKIAGDGAGITIYEEG